MMNVSLAAPAAIETEKSDSISDFEMIVRLYRPRVFRFIAASLRDAEAAENLTQDCFLRAYKAYGAFRSDCKLSTWLMQIAVNLLRDHAKSRRLQFWRRLRESGKQLEGDFWGSLADHRQSAEARMVLEEQVQGIWKVAELLPEKQRTVFLLRFVEDMDVTEIALAMGSSVSTAKTHLQRALTSVRQALGQAA